MGQALAAQHPRRQRVHGGALRVNGLQIKVGQQLAHQGCAVPGGRLHHQRPATFGPGAHGVATVGSRQQRTQRCPVVALHCRMELLAETLPKAVLVPRQIQQNVRGMEALLPVQPEALLHQGTRNPPIEVQTHHDAIIPFFKCLVHIGASAHQRVDDLRIVVVVPHCFF